MTWAWRRIRRYRPALPLAMIQVLDQQGQRCASRQAFHHPSEDLYTVVLDLHARPSSIALLAANQFKVNRASIDGQPGRHPFQDCDQGGTVRFTSG